jgi:2-aminoadipate transaminase
MTTPTISTTRLASRASELKGSVIDASTALLASQTP